MTLPRIALVGTGGTIASIGADALDLANYGDTKRILHADELAAAVPALARVAEIRPVRWRAIPAVEMSPAHWIELARLIEQLAAAPDAPDGFVVTHGTASLEETAYFLNLVLKTDRPVVLTGSQRPFSAVSSDAQLNLLNAVRVAGHPDSRGKGVLVVLNDEINAAREVTKTQTYRLQSFRCPDVGALGSADADRVVFYRAPTRRHTLATPFSVATADPFPRVDVVTSYAGADGTLIAAAVAAGARGIVAAGFAPGWGTPGENAALAEACARGIVVVQAARALGGRVDPRDRLRAAGYVAADSLPAHKARILLGLALGVTQEPAGVQELFLSC
jgi:L-asparaginase